MAVTKMWSVKGGEAGLKGSLDYTTNEQKTDPNAIAFLTMRDIIDFQGQEQERRELEIALGYTLQPGKTEEKYVSCLNCAQESALTEMMAIKHQWGKLDSIQCIHAVQSFKPGEITPEVAHNIGLELSQKLWGDRFQVVVSTHLDREHIHNHFIINSVSFLDGKRFYRNNETYDLMRVTSDQLCREYGVSVIERPQRGRLPSPNAYDQAGVIRPEAGYIRIKKDIDDAIRQSRNMTEFFSYLTNLGYTFRQGNLKNFTLRAPGAGKSCRIDKWIAEKYGLDYSLEGIARMIEEANHLPREPPENGVSEIPTPFLPEFDPKVVDTTYDLPEQHYDTLPDISVPEQNLPHIPMWRSPALRKMRFRGKFRKSGSIVPRNTHFRRLYLYYCYLFGVFPKHRQCSFSTRSEVYRMRNIAKETRLLITNGIDTLAQLAVYRAEKQTNVTVLCTQRKALYNRLRSGTPEENAGTQAQIDALREDIRCEREQIRLCDDIRARSIREAQYQSRKELYNDPSTEKDLFTDTETSKKEEQNYASRTRCSEHGNEPDHLASY